VHYKSSLIFGGSLNLFLYHLVFYVFGTALGMGIADILLVGYQSKVPFKQSGKMLFIHEGWAEKGRKSNITKVGRKQLSDSSLLNHLQIA